MQISNFLFIRFFVKSCSLFKCIPLKVLRYYVYCTISFFLKVEIKEISIKLLYLVKEFCIPVHFLLKIIRKKENDANDKIFNLIIPRESWGILF